MSVNELTSKNNNTDIDNQNTEEQPAASAINNFDLSTNNGELFFNRETSWIEFNFRVLEEAHRSDNPLLERLKFLAITESNLEEFFMVRVAGLKQIVASSVTEAQLDGKTPEETLHTIYKMVHEMVEEQIRLFDEIRCGLRDSGIHIIDDFQELNSVEKDFVSDFFDREFFPVLTPLAVDPSHPFPHIANGHLNKAIILERDKEDGTKKEVYAFVEVPTIFPRFVELPPRGDMVGGRPVRRFLAIEEILKFRVDELFPGSRVKSIHGISITRNSDLSIDEVASENLLSTIEDELKNRMWGEAVRMNYRSGLPDRLREFIRVQLDMEEDELFERPGILNLQDLWGVYNRCKEYSELRDQPFIPKNVLPVEKPEKIFGIVRKGDIFLHHPYDSFQTIVDMLSYAARDPKVLAIKQTLYRTSGDSPVVRSLIKAAENGKQVTVLVELKARFDEENNIVWARSMERHGVHVVYGLVGLKIHCKLLQIIRKEDDGVKSYVHLATGNYNPTTAKIYTDMGLITTHPEINMDVTRLFHAMTGSSGFVNLEHIAAAPINLRERLTELIEQEIENAKKGKTARIRLKLNALVDSDMIILLYRASQAGVSIELSIRGICCLKPGIPGLSENIRVESTVGRFLEHSRIYYFENAGDPKIFLSSADWMRRNLNRRIEVMFPVYDLEIRKRVIHILDISFRDNHNARRLDYTGRYSRVKPETEAERFSSQRYFRDEANKEFENREMNRAEKRKSIFRPVTNPDANLDSNQENEKSKIPRDLDV